MKKIFEIFSKPKTEITPKYTVNPIIFKEYDIRGIYNSTLFDKDAFLIGRALAAANNGHINVVLGCDSRNSSPALQKNIIRGFVTSGAKVTNIGICPTPLLYYSVAVGNFDLGIMITGSHNPPSHNGFKIVKKDTPIFGEQIQTIKDAIDNTRFVDGTGREIFLLNNYSREYVKKALENVDIYGSVNVAWDIGNGATSEIVRKIIKQLPGRHIVLNAEMDGNFPGRDPDPTINSNITELIDIVKREKLDMGIAFDGDGDRIVVVDNNGNPLQGDQLLCIIARSVLKTNKGASIILDTKASMFVIDDIRKNGGIPIMERSGHSIIEAKMKETHAILAGEMSGHIFFADKWFGFDDGIYSALRILEIYTSERNLGNNIFDDIPAGFNTPEIRIDCTNSAEVLYTIRQQLKNADVDIIEKDGLRVERSNGWWLIRASNTQAQLTLRVEGITAEDLKLLKGELSNYLHGAGIEYKFA